MSPLLPARMFTYGTLRVQSNGNLAAGLGLLGSAGIVDDRLVVRVLSLQADVSGMVLASQTSVETYVGEVPGMRKSVLLRFISRGNGVFGDCSHPDNVKTGSPKLVDGLDGVRLGANCANLFVRSSASAAISRVLSIASSIGLRRVLRWMCGGSSWRAGRQCRAGRASRCDLRGRGGRGR